MKYNLLVLFSVFIAQVSLSQNTDLNPNRTKKGSLYFYWGLESGLVQQIRLALQRGLIMTLH